MDKRLGATSDTRDSHREGGDSALRRLLFIDDDQLYREAFQRLLQSRGYEVDVAASGDEAIGLVRSRHYSLVISDLMLPRLDGLKVIEQIRRVQEGPRYILTTGQDPKRVQQAVETTHVDGVLWKPWAPTEAVSMIERLSDPQASAVTRVHTLLQIAGTVLVVEDNPGDRDLLADYIADGLAPGASMAFASSMSEAVRYLREQASPSIILLDLSLPDARRLDGLKRLLQCSVEAPIVVVSGSTDESLALEAVEAGAQDYLFKDQLHPRGLLLTMRHAIDRRRAQERLAHAALYDRLTGAANRNQFQSVLERSIKEATLEGRKIALLFMDLDDFKQVNDRFGHQVGDTLLAAFAMRLMERLSQQQMLARLGGDEFVVLAPGVESIEAARELAASLLDATAPPVELIGQTHELSSSVGVALFPDNGANADQLLRHADLDMYRSKGRRRRHSNGPERGGDDYLLQAELEGSLRPALARGEFVPQYQAVVELPSERVTDIELLLRWYKSGEGICAPGSFLPLLQDTGMIIPVARSALYEGFRQLRRFQLAVKRPCRLSFNLSGVELSERSFRDELERLLDDSDIAPTELQVEVTEDVLSSDSRAVLASLTALRTMGAELCLDGFGTGMSSLHRLADAGLSAVKIDRSVVATLDQKSEGGAFVAATVAAARVIGMRVIAVGVETAPQQRVLELLGCSYAQGSYYAQPMPAHALGTWLAFKSGD